MRVSIKHSKLFSAIFEKFTKVRLNKPITGVSTDSREIHNGDLYIALVGQKVDGHSFLTMAEISGASAALVKNQSEELNIQQIKTDNPILLISKIANDWRRNFDIPVIGITGSNGKTSTKELLSHVLKSKYQVHATEGNFNTSIGVPLTLLGINESHEIAILELGASIMGEIKSLCRIARPTYGLITNIAPAHLEGFGSLKNIAHEKGALFRFSDDCTSFVNKADKLISKLSTRGKRVTYGLNQESDFKADIVHEDDNKLTLIVNNHIIKTKSQNLSFIKNCIAVYAVSVTIGVDLKDIENSFKNFEGPRGRCFVKQIKSMTIIDDTYNANLTSSLASLDYLEAFSGNGRKLFVFGDMFELGPSSNQQHRKIGIKCSQLNLDIVYTIGEYSKHTGYALDNKIEHSHFSDQKELIQTLKNILLPGDKVLFKGSRGMRMENIIEGVFKS